MFSVLIVDQSTLLRCGLKHVLVADLRAAAVGEAANLEVARDQFKRRFWEVVVLGLPLSELAPETVGELKQSLPSTRILLLGLERNNRMVTRAIKAGASGYLRKDALLAEVVRAFRSILAGEQYISDTFTPASAALPRTNLSNREHFVLTAIAEGKRIGEIAGELKLDVRTVSTYRRRALQKMSMQTDAELIRYITSQGRDADPQRQETQ